MKRLLGTILMGCASLYASAQSSGTYQFSDPGFEQFISGKEPGNGWNSFASATGSMASMGKDMSPNPTPVTPGANGSQRAVKLFSKEVGALFFKAYANGNMTTGVINMGSATPNNPANHNFSNTSSRAQSMEFAGRPDLVTFYAKFKAGGNNKKKVGSANFILHDECQYKDPEDASQKSNRIGKASFLIPESSDWTKYEVPFVYDKEYSGKQYLLASITTNPAPGESVGDELLIDEILFVYYYTLSSLSYEDLEVNFNEQDLTYDLSAVGYQKGKLHYTTKGAGAQVEEHYDTETGLLTLTVKGSDYSQQPEHITVYQLQFNKAAVEPLQEAITDLGQLEANSTYALYNEHFTAYTSFHPEHSQYIWTKNMIGDDTHPLVSDQYAQPFSIMEHNSSWMVIPAAESKYYLYNLGAKKFLKTPGYGGTTSPCTFSDTPVALTVENLGDGNFALTATGHTNDYLCAAPNNHTSPVSIWTKEDGGAAWQFKKNPNIAAERNIIEEFYAPKMGAKVTALSQIDIHKTYVLRNPHYTAYAIYAPKYSEKIVWTAEMSGDDKDHPLKHQEFSEKAKLMKANSNWMLIPQEDGYYLYNIGAKKYLSTPIETKENVEKGCFFSAKPVKMYLEDLGEGRFAFTSSKDPKDYMCAAPQLNTPISNWQKNDPGAAWEITENLDVKADQHIIDQFYVPELGQRVEHLSQVKLNKAYVLRNEAFTAYAVYAPEHSAEYLWAAEMKGDATHALNQESYAEKAKLTTANSSWMVIPIEDGCYLYNIGAKKYLSSPIEVDKAKGCTFSDYPVKLFASELGNGKFTFSATKAELDFICASPQLNVPISNWASGDPGAAWEITENPNVLADMTVAERFTLPSLGAVINDLTKLDTKKTYLLRNPHFTAFAVYAPAQSTKSVWTANMVGDLNHPLSNDSFFHKVDVKSASSSWMLLSKDDGFYFYNVGAKQYLNVVEGNFCFSKEPAKLYLQSADRHTFSISQTVTAENVMCATPHLKNTPISGASSAEKGTAWEIIENPYVTAHPSIIDEEPGTALLTDLRYKGTPLSGFSKDKFNYTVNGEYTEGCLSFTLEDGDKATATTTYDETSSTATITIIAKHGEAKHHYKIVFKAESPTTITNYYGEMNITMDGKFVAKSDKPIGISSPKNGMVNLQLLDFELEGLGNIGNIYITEVPYRPDSHGNVTLHKEQKIVIDGEIGAGLGKLPTILDGNIANGQLTCTINISWNGISIIVEVTPKSATGIIGIVDNGHLQKVNVYSLNGVLILQQVPWATALQQLPAGVYIVNGKKIIK